MKKAIKIEDLPSGLDETAVQVFRIIVLKLGERRRGRVEYIQIARSLGTERSVVSKAVKRLERKRIIALIGGEIELLNVVDIEV